MIWRMEDRATTDVTDRPPIVLHSASLVVAVVGCGIGMMLIAGCATAPPTAQAIPPTQAIPSLAGSYHVVQRGDTLWRIAHSYGLDSQRLASANRLSRSSSLTVGQQLFIPLPTESNRFLWPARGSLRQSSASHGVDIAAPTGSLVRASRTGRVAVATHDLSGWGKTVVIDHQDGYLTIYAGLEQILTNPGRLVRQGSPIGNLGVRALHFEIRYGDRPRDTLALLPPG